MEKPVFVDAEIVKEDWSVYKVEDGTIVKVRYVLVKARKGTANQFGQPGYDLSMKNIIGMIPRPGGLDKPSVSYDKATLTQSIEKEDMEFEKIREPWNEYRMSDGSTIKIQAILTIVSRTSKYDENGEQIYLLNFQPIVKALPPHK